MSKTKTATKEAEPNTVVAQGNGGELTVYDETLAGAGFEGSSREDYAVPFLRILQSNSPQVVDKTVPDAQPGLIFNNVTQELFKEVTFIPCSRDHNYVEYIPREAGGGFVGIRPADDPLVVDLIKRHGGFTKLPTAEGHELVQTFYIFGLNVREDGNVEQDVVSFSSTQIKKYKNWMTTASTLMHKRANNTMMRLPLFAHKWTLTTVPEKNKKGSFWGWRITLGERLAPNDPLFQLARGFHEVVKSGAVKAAHDAGEQPTGSEEDPPY